MEEKFQIENINSEELIKTQYKEVDKNLLQPVVINKLFGEKDDIIEFHILDNNNNVLETNYNFKNYTNRNTVNNSILYDEIELNPEEDLLLYGYSDGEYNLLYNFYKNLFKSSYKSKYFISEISLDRTEIKISNPNLIDNELESSYLEFITKRNENNFYSDFILNFGENNTLIAVNVILDSNTNNSLFIKLYEPLPTNINTKSELWINEIISESYIFNLQKEFIFNNTSEKQKLKGPNFNIEINNNISTNTPYLNISNILDSGSLDINYLKSLTKDIKINIDFNEFKNFVHFSSAKERIENFICKLSNLEQLQNDLNVITNISGSSYSTLININNKINNLINSFDEYENFLYYESGSNSFPKSNNQKPYINKPISDIESLEWVGSSDYSNQYYGGKLLEADNYDIENRDYIWNNLPDYIKLDEQNDQLKLFISMIGQYFDSIWVYIKDITNKNIADNRINYGISKDLVAETLKSFGIKLYTNSRNQNNIFQSFTGVNPDGTFLPSTGSYNINTYITASNYTVPDDDINKEIYKRIYHNLPYLLKSKGTKKGLRALLNCFGIPRTILDIKEYGGNIKELDLIENKIEKFNYSFNGNNDGYIQVPFYPSYQQYLQTTGSIIYPDNIEFRFKASIPTVISQSLLYDDNDDIKILLNYQSESYGEIQLLINGLGNVLSSPISLPYFNNDWWNINLYRETGSYPYSTSSINNTYTIVISNKELGYYSASINDDGFFEPKWGDQKIFNIGNFSGSIQEFRYWIGKPSINDIKNHTENPKSFSYLNETGSYNNLIFRLPLGSELDNNIQEYITSSHPSKIESFIIGGVSSSYAIVFNTQSISYEPNIEYYLINNPNTGGSTESNQKIKIIESELIDGNTLSYSNSIQKKNLNQINNSNNLEVAFSPQNSINDDIIKQLGNFNIDEFIGDPREKGLTKYKELEKLKLFYFKKYLDKSNIYDLIKLLSYFDNSLFKMIKDFTPARTNLSTGLVIKSHVLERNKIQKFEPIITQEYKEGDINTAFITGSNGLGEYINTSYIGSINTVLGKINFISNDYKELYNGEFNNSNIIAYENIKNIVLEENNINPEYNIKQDIILNPILNNVEENIKNKKLLNISNINELTSSLLNNTQNKILFSDVQEYNYNLKKYNDSRYNGCKLISKEYNRFNNGDKSYGNQPVINNNKIKFAYFEEITSQSLTLPKRSNVYLKYLIDEDSNITELSQQNQNSFEIQNIFNIDKVNIVLDNNQSPSIQRNLDGETSIYAGGYKFKPVLQNLTTLTTTGSFMEFIYENDLQIINDSSSSITQNLPVGSLIFGTPIYEGTLLKNNNNNTELIYNNNFKIKFPITRNTPYPGEIRQKITGSVIINMEVSPFENFKTTFWRNKNGTGQKWEVTGVYESTLVNSGTPFDNPLYGANDSVQSITLPAGAKVFVAGAGNFTGPIFTANTPGFYTLNGGCPLCLSGNGLTGVKIESTGDTTIIKTLQSYQNDFNTSIPNLIQTPNPQIISGSTIIQLEYNIEGDIIIPEGSMQGEFYLLRSNTNTQGLIKSVVKINTTNNTTIYSSQPTSIDTTNLNFNNLPFYYTNPPDYLYITGAVDYGYNSGSAPIDNWFFERTNGLETGSFYNRIIGSSYLSNIIYSVIENNRIIQNEENMVNLGYEQIEDYFNIRKGDLIRFYNYDKDSFPIDFETEIKNIIFPTGISDENSYDNRFIIETVREIPNQACLDYFESGSFSKKIQNFIILSKKEDETNIVINKQKRDGKTSSGIIYTNLPTNIKDKVGNIIKELKNQNLI